MTKNKKSVKKIKELEQKIKENPDVIKVYHNDILVDIIDNKDDKIKLEIGSSVRPDPYSKKTFKSYIHNYLSAL